MNDLAFVYSNNEVNLQKVNKEVYYVYGNKKNKFN